MKIVLGFRCVRFDVKNGGWSDCRGYLARRALEMLGSILRAVDSETLRMSPWSRNDEG